MLPWECEECGYKCEDSVFITYNNCPECGSECFYHGSLIEEDFEEYNIYDEDDL